MTEETILLEEVWEVGSTRTPVKLAKGAFVVILNT